MLERNLPRITFSAVDEQPEGWAVSKDLRKRSEDSVVAHK